LSINGVNYSFRKHEVGDETARDGCQVRLVNDILYSSEDTFCWNFFQVCDKYKGAGARALNFRLLGSGSTTRNLSVALFEGLKASGKAVHREAFLNTIFSYSVYNFFISLFRSTKNHPEAAGLFMDELASVMRQPLPARYILPFGFA
jgi:hypothetical protein